MQFGHNTTFNTCDFSLKDYVNRLEQDGNLAVKQFDSNHMKLNNYKYHLTILVTNTKQFSY